GAYLLAAALITLTGHVVVETHINELVEPVLLELEIGLDVLQLVGSGTWAAFHPAYRMADARADRNLTTANEPWPARNDRHLGGGRDQLRVFGRRGRVCRRSGRRQRGGGLGAGRNERRLARATREQGSADRDGQLS